MLLSRIPFWYNIVPIPGGRIQNVGNIMNNATGFRENWPWNKNFLRLMFLVPSALGILATALCYPIAGIHALWFLTAIFAGVVMYVVYGFVGNKVTALKEKNARHQGEMAEGLLVIGGIQSPGIVIMRTNEIELIPIVGKSCKIPFDAIRSTKEGRWLPGKFVWGKLAFNFDTTLEKRLAFAVAESVGKRWSPTLSRPG